MMESKRKKYNGEGRKDDIVCVAREGIAKALCIENVYASSFILPYRLADVFVLS